MSDERKYRPEEVMEILELAANRTEVGRPAAFDEGRLTLSEIEAAGREVGIEPGKSPRQR